jgi:tetratricopeptide (TPR) repeat protein
LQGLRFFRTRLAFFAEPERAIVLNGRNEHERRALLAQFNAQERESLEFAVQDICRALDVRFVPAYIGDRRLPLHQRFEEELEDARQFHHTEKARDTFARLMEARTQLGLWLDDGSLNRALDAIQYFNAICKYELPGHEFYYPQIVQAVCLLNLGLLNEAEEVLLPLLKHPRKDESLYSALGVICFHRRDHAQACLWYSKALAAARERGEADPAASHGLLANALRCDFQVDIGSILDELAHTEIAVPADRIKVQALQAAVHVHQGRLQEASHIYQSMGPALLEQPEVLIDYADLLALPELNRKLEGLRLLEESEAKHGHIGPFRDRLAMWNYQLERFDAAERHAQRLIADFPLHRRYHMHAAQIFHRRQAPLARRIARDVLSPRFGLPATPDDFFYCGMANWYLENLDRAEFDFERSGRPDNAHYRHLA